ncbi:hypothetical protein ACQ4LK_21650 [Bacillus pumilus]
MFIPDGVSHQHVNTGDEPLWLIWLYTPQGQLPKLSLIHISSPRDPLHDLVSPLLL